MLPRSLPSDGRSAAVAFPLDGVDRRGGLPDVRGRVLRDRPGPADGVGPVLREPLRGEWLSGSTYRALSNPHYNMDYMGKGFVTYRMECAIKLPPGGTLAVQRN